jgi:hypothetical protein
MTQRDAALNIIGATGTSGCDHDSLEIATGFPKATVRRLTQELRQRGLIRLSHFHTSGAPVFVAATVPSPALPVAQA